MHQVYEVLAELDCTEKLDADHLNGLADATWWTRRMDGSIEARTRAYAARLERGEERRGSERAPLGPRPQAHALWPARSVVGAPSACSPEGRLPAVRLPGTDALTPRAGRGRLRLCDRARGADARARQPLPRSEPDGARPARQRRCARPKGDAETGLALINEADDPKRSSRNVRARRPKATRRRRASRRTQAASANPTKPSLRRAPRRRTPLALL